MQVTSENKTGKDSDSIELPPIPEIELVPDNAASSPCQSADWSEILLFLAEHARASSAIVLKLDSLEAAIDGLKKQFEQRLCYDQVKERALEYLKGKMEQTNTDFQVSLKQGLIKSLLLLHDHMQSVEASIENALDQRNQVADLRQELIDILYAEDLEPIKTESAVFDRRLQQSIGLIPTNNRAEDGIVDRIVRDGFCQSGKVIRPQAVFVRRYLPISNPSIETS